MPNYVRPKRHGDGRNVDYSTSERNPRPRTWSDTEGQAKALRHASAGFVASSPTLPPKDRAMTTTTKKKLIVGVIAVTVAAVSAACSTERDIKSSGGKVDTLNMTTEGPTYTRNFNTFSPSSNKSPGRDYFYEPLVRVDATDANKAKPWLAKSFHYSNGGKTLTFKLRDDVKWSDGKPLTSKDVKYTLELPSKTKGLGAAPVPNLKKVTTPDKHTAIVHYTKSQLHDLANYGDDPRLIVPAHIWKKHNPKKWTNPQPVGTGAFTLERYSSQSIKLKTRNDYWNGKFKGVKHVNMKAFGDESSGKQMLLKNKASWGGMSWQNYKSDFVKKDPKRNKVWTYPLGNTEGLLFNFKKSPTDNVHIRRALYASLDSKGLTKLYNYGQKPANPTGLGSNVWGKYMPSKFRHARHKQDTDKAKSELKASGFKVKDGKLTKNGKSYPISLKTNSDYGNWEAYTPGLKRQWKRVLDLEVSVKKSPSDQWGDNESEGDFQVLYDNPINGGEDIWSGMHTQLSGDYLKPVGTSANGNYGRYKNPKVDTLLDKMGKTRDKKKLKKYASKIQEIVVDDVPYAPLHTSTTVSDINTTDWTGWPNSDRAKYIAHLDGQGPDSTLTIQNLKPNATK